LGWLRCLDVMLERDATLRQGLAVAGWTIDEGDEPVVDRKAKRVVLAGLPEPATAGTDAAVEVGHQGLPGRQRLEA